MKSVHRAVVCLSSAAMLSGCGNWSDLPRGLQRAGDAKIQNVDSRLVAALRQAAVPLTTVMPQGDARDLEPFKHAIGRSRIVGLGEATHGTSEFFRMKHRLFRYLVEEAGFTVFAIEANWANTLAADRYVKTGEGSAYSAAAGLGFGIWRTAEVRDLLEWMRQYNQAHGPVVSVAGVDMQNPGPSFEAVPRYLSLLGPEIGKMATEAFAPYAKAGTSYSELPVAERAACRAAIARMEAVFEEKQERLIAASSPEAYRLARHHARIIAQAEAMDSAGGFSDVALNMRDAAMAENARWIADVAYPGCKMVVWGHNAHVGTYTNLYGMNWKVMGAHLRDHYGQGYYALGFTFDRGTVRAFLDEGKGPQPNLDVLPVPAARPDSISGAFARATAPLSFLNVRGVSSDSPLRRWLNTELPLRHIGATYDPKRANLFYAPTVLSQTFDGLIHVAEAHASDLLPRPSTALDESLNADERRAVGLSGPPKPKK